MEELYAFEDSLADKGIEFITHLNRNSDRYYVETFEYTHVFSLEGKHLKSEDFIYDEDKIEYVK